MPHLPATIDRNGKSWRVLNAINGWAPVTIGQISKILHLRPETAVREFRNLRNLSLISNIGRPKLPHSHPLFGCYHIPINLPKLKAFLPNARVVHRRRMKYYSPPISSGDLFFRAGEADSNAWCKFSRHRVIVNYVAAWMAKTVASASKANLLLIPEYDLRTLRKWHFSASESSGTGGGIEAGGDVVALPDFLIGSKKFEIFVEVELEQKSAGYYDMYFNHLRENRVIYMVSTTQIGEAIMRMVPKNVIADYAIIGHEQGLMAALASVTV